MPRFHISYTLSKITNQIIMPCDGRATAIFSISTWDGMAVKQQPPIRHKSEKMPKKENLMCAKCSFNCTGREKLVKITSAI